jgi:hypothetical protein
MAKPAEHSEDEYEEEYEEYTDQFEDEFDEDDGEQQQQRCRDGLIASSRTRQAICFRSGT